MTTASPDDSTVRYADTIRSRASYAQAAEPDWSGWQRWLDGAIENERNVMTEVIGEVVADLERKIKNLELGLATATGALDVLRGKGVPGCFHVRGTHDARSTYNYLDVVAYNGASWVATRDNPGDVPGPGWQLLASQGSRGVRGERGPAGPAGVPPTFAGARFSHRGMEIETSTGSISLFKSVNVDPQNFTIKFIANDDSALTISLLPLFESYHSQTTP
jgi:hypothetical protein